MSSNSTSISLLTSHTSTHTNGNVGSSAIAIKEEIWSEDVQAEEEEWAHYSSTKHYFYIAVFFMVGVCQLMIWNMVINSFTAMQFYIWPGHNYADILGGCEHGAALLVAIGMLGYDGYNKWIVLGSTGAPICLYLLFPLVTQFCAGNENASLGEGLSCAIAILCGICVGFMHVYGYSYASALPKDYVGYVSAGNGFSGVYSFVVYEVFAETGIFPQTLEGQQQLIWVFFAFGALTSIVTLWMVWKMVRDPLVQLAVERSKKKREALKEDPRHPPPRPLLQILKDCWFPAFNAACPLFLTLCMFPGLGPYSWGLSYSWSSGLNGVFQCADFLFRFIPNLGSWTMLPKSWLIWINIFRYIFFIPFFEIPFRLPETPVITTPGWLCFIMVFFTLTNGWTVTVASIYTCGSVSNPREKEIASEILVIGLLAFITAGLFFGKVFVLNPPQ